MDKHLLRPGPGHPRMRKAYCSANVSSFDAAVTATVGEETCNKCKTVLASELLLNVEKLVKNDS